MKKTYIESNYIQKHILFFFLVFRKVIFFITHPQTYVKFYIQRLDKFQCKYVNVCAFVMQYSQNIRQNCYGKIKSLLIFAKDNAQTDDNKKKIQW